jgi:hypothetical protein
VLGSYAIIRARIKWFAEHLTHALRIALIAHPERDHTLLKIKLRWFLRSVKWMFARGFDSESRDAAMGVLDDTLDDDALGDYWVTRVCTVLIGAIS